MMHQNFQSFGTPREGSLEGLGEDDRHGEDSMANLPVVIQVCLWERKDVGERSRDLKNGY